MAVAWAAECRYRVGRWASNDAAWSAPANRAQARTPPVALSGMLPRGTG